jgi:predicted ArsR family transcriptional regulator
LTKRWLHFIVESMEETPLLTTRRDERFFSSTRGQVVTLLRGGSRTVDELAVELDLTDNAIRAHLTGLERDGLVRQGAPRRGVGKPSHTFELTEESERLFPRAYGVLLNQLLSVLTERIPPDQLADVLREVGHRLPTGHATPSGDVRSRVEQAVALLSSLGGFAEVEEIPGGYAIQGCTCPLAAAVEATSDACLLAEALLSDATGLRVCHVCDQGPPPRCRFEIAANGH